MACNWCTGHFVGLGFPWLIMLFSPCVSELLSYVGVFVYQVLPTFELCQTEKLFLHMRKAEAQISCVVHRYIGSQSLYFLNPNFQASNRQPPWPSG